MERNEMTTLLIDVFEKLSPSGVEIKGNSFNVVVKDLEAAGVDSSRVSVIQTGAGSVTSISVRFDGDGINRLLQLVDMEREYTAFKSNKKSK